MCSSRTLTRVFDVTYSIIGSGSVATAIARQFARSDITVGIANGHGPDSIASTANELGDKVVPLTLQEALKADVITARKDRRAGRHRGGRTLPRIR